jgi:hypothetical protein
MMALLGPLGTVVSAMSLFTSILLRMLIESWLSMVKQTQYEEKIADVVRVYAVSVRRSYCLIFVRIRVDLVWVR